jgi:transposase
MEKFQHIIGVDLSKKTIDLFCFETSKHLKIDNDKTGFKQMLKWFKAQQICCSQTMLVMEHTGLYSFCFEDFLHEHQIGFTKVNALAIKHSMGLVRGKTDKTDAQRIARYGFEKQDALQPAPPSDKTLQRLQMLQSTRDRLVKHNAALLNALKEYEHIGLSKQDLMMQSQTRLMKQFEKEIEKLEDEIKTLIQSEADLQRNHELLLTVKSIGTVTATHMLIKTKSFTMFTDARKFACYCGTAPFEHSSGSSIRGKTRVSHLADKRMKSLLDRCAWSAIQHDKELKEYYQKRVEAGKSKMSTINIIRNKLLYRMFAVIKRQTPFVENYLQAA